MSSPMMPREPKAIPAQPILERACPFVKIERSTEKILRVVVTVALLRGPYSETTKKMKDWPTAEQAAKLNTFVIISGFAIMNAAPGATSPRPNATATPTQNMKKFVQNIM